jgi:uncharacterized membrane protein
MNAPQHEGEKMETKESPITVERNTIMAILSYIGPLVIIPYLTAKDDAFVLFHIKQGLVLFVIEIILWVLMGMFWFLYPVWQLINLALFVLAIIGIVNALNGKEKQLPLVGKYAGTFKI